MFLAQNIALDSRQPAKFVDNNKLGQNVSIDYLSSSGLKTISKKQKATKLLERHMSSLKIIQHVSSKTQRQVSLPKFLPEV